MAIKFSDEENKVITNIVGACESGGQIYGNRNYGAFAEAGKNVANETAITIGWCQNYATNAQKLLLRIQKANPTLFAKLDNAGIASDLINCDWRYYAVKKDSDKAKAIIALITSDVGKKCQDDMFAEQCQSYIDHAEKLGVTDHTGLAEAINICHHGGKGSFTRVIGKTHKPYNVETIYAALQTDTGNQVGGPLYRRRQKLVYDWIKQYWPKEDNEIILESNNKEIIIESNNKEKDILDKGGNNMSKITYPAGYISNSGHDENGAYHGGKAGDQSKTEWEIRKFYVKPWNCVLRYKDPKVRKLIAQLAIEAANNDHIGYDQYQRTTFWYQLAKAGYHPKNITIDCEADCSAGVTAICKATGYLLDIPGLKNLSPDIYTGNLKKSFKAAGFEVLTGSKYLNGPDYLLAGDILLNEGHHVATCISSGAKSGEGTTEYDGANVTINGVSSSTATASNNTTTSSTALSTTVRSNVYVKENGTKLYTWAGKENSQLKSYPVVNKNQVLGLCDQTKAKDGSIWYFVKIDNKYGFVEASAVSDRKIEDDILLDTPKVNTVDKANKKVTVNGVEMDLNTGRTLKNKKYVWVGQVDVGSGNRLNYRVWPGEKSNLLTSMPYINNGAAVFVYDVMLDANNNIWLYINTENPTTGKKPFGFVRAEYIKKI